MSVLYKSASGREINHVSYSAISDYEYCPELFRLSRIEGWKDKNKRGAFEFGKCVEDAIQFYHANNLKPGDGVDEFKRLWLKWQDQPLTFTVQEGSWQDLYGMGSDLLRLYEIYLPTLPIKNAKFQLNYAKPLWPGSNLSHLEFTSFIDLLSTQEDGSRILVDIKTAKSPLDVTPNILSLYPQLKDYAWATGIREVAFLWLIKGRPSFRKGDTVLLLDDTRDWKAGAELSVFKYEEKASETEGEPPTKLITLATEETIRKMDEELDAIKGKGSTEAKTAVVSAYLADGRLCVTSREAVTKTRLQFVRATIPEKELPAVGQYIGDKLFQIKNSYETNSWPKTGGVRFPNTKCPNCRMRGLCLNRPDLVDQLIVKIGPQVEEDDWLKELETEDSE